jgi:hypothetical protein
MSHISDPKRNCLSVSVWCLLLGVVREGYWVWIRERNSSSLASGSYCPAQPSIIARQLGMKCKFAPFRFGRGVSQRAHTF